MVYHEHQVLVPRTRGIPDAMLVGSLGSCCCSAPPELDRAQTRAFQGSLKGLLAILWRRVFCQVFYNLGSFLDFGVLAKFVG